MCDYRIGVERNHTVLLLYESVYKKSMLFLKTFTKKFLKAGCLH